MRFGLVSSKVFSVSLILAGVLVPVFSRFARSCTLAVMFGHVASVMFSISRSLTLMLPDIPGFIFTFSSSGSRSRPSSGSPCGSGTLCAFAVSLIKRFDRVGLWLALVH